VKLVVVNESGISGVLSVIGILSNTSTFLVTNEETSISHFPPVCYRKGKDGYLDEVPEEARKEGKLILFHVEKRIEVLSP